MNLLFDNFKENEMWKKVGSPETKMSKTNHFYRWIDIILYSRKYVLFLNAQNILL